MTGGALHVHVEEVEGCVGYVCMYGGAEGQLVCGGTVQNYMCCSPHQCCPKYSKCRQVVSKWVHMCTV